MFILKTSRHNKLVQTLDCNRLTKGMKVIGSLIGSMVFKFPFTKVYYFFNLHVLKKEVDIAPPVL